MKQHELAAQLPEIVEQARQGHDLSLEVVMWLLSDIERTGTHDEQQSLARSRLGVYDLYCSVCGVPGRAQIGSATEWRCPDHIEAPDA